MNGRIRWFTFHGAVDACYLMKCINPYIKSTDDLKTLINENMRTVYDLKRVRGGSLETLAETL